MQLFPGNLSRRQLLAGALAVGALGMAGCSKLPPPGKVEGGSLLEKLRDRGFVKVGIANEPPFGYIDRDGEPTGEAPAIAKTIFRALGVEEVIPVPVDFSALIPGLNAQLFDVVSAGMYINPTRCEHVLFADPDYLMLDAFVVEAGNPHGIASYQDIANQGLQMATGQAWAQLGYATAAGVPKSKILQLPDQVAGVEAVEQGRVVALAGTAVTVRNVVKGKENLQATPSFQPYVDGEPAYGAGGFAFRLSEKNLRDAFNTELHKLKQSGDLLKIVRPFGFTETEMTDFTATELCQ